MSLWGKIDQSVTANSTTTKESTAGAPIGTQGLVKKGRNIPGTAANAHFGNTSSGSRAAVDVSMYENTTPGAFISGASIGIFGVSATEMANNTINKSKESPAHAGWVVRTAGTGGITQVGYTGTATGYSNTDVGTVASPQAGGNASFSFSTNSTGGAISLTITNPGKGFFAVNASANVVVANSTGGASGGSGATFNAVAGGRAGRVFTETLVAMGSITSDGSDNTQYPGT